MRLPCGTDALLQHIQIPAAGQDGQIRVLRDFTCAVVYRQNQASAAHVHCVDAAVQLGLPEARIPLAQAVIHLATAPKSNSVMQAIAAAQEDIARGKIGHVPPHLRDGHYEGAKRLGSAVGYKFPHDDPRGVVAQQYLPQELADARYYQPTNHGAEKRIYEYLPRLRGIVRDEKNAGRSK